MIGLQNFGYNAVKTFFLNKPFSALREIIINQRGIARSFLKYRPLFATFIKKEILSIRFKLV